MSRAKPISFDTLLVYICSRCGSNNHLEVAEAKTAGFKASCPCGHIYPIQRIADISFNIDYDDSPRRVKKQLASSDNVSDAVQILLSQGYTVEDINQMRVGIGDMNSMSIENIIKRLLANVKPVKTNEV